MSTGAGAYAKNPFSTRKRNSSQSVASNAGVSGINQAKKPVPGASSLPEDLYPTQPQEPTPQSADPLPSGESKYTIVNEPSSFAGSDGTGPKPPSGRAADAREAGIVRTTHPDTIVDDPDLAPPEPPKTFTPVDDNVVVPYEPDTLGGNVIGFDKDDSFNSLEALLRGLGLPAPQLGRRESWTR